jgi:hypothetical protein
MRKGVNFMLPANATPCARKSLFFKFGKSKMQVCAKLKVWYVFVQT